MLNVGEELTDQRELIFNGRREEGELKYAARGARAK
jgi:hypothetical protein